MRKESMSYPVAEKPYCVYCHYKETGSTHLCALASDLRARCPNLPNPLFEYIFEREKN